MCGITGIINGNVNLIHPMINTLTHRGPDGLGVYVKDNVALGHARLSIIDLNSRSSQPFYYEAMNGNKYTIVFNGEIYNYIEVKEKLKSLGCLFATTSDTEVLVAAYSYWGKNAISHFNGMWSFAIYDETEGTLFLSRDRFGVKPLYYALIGKVLVFSSELKGLNFYFNENNISLNIDKEALELYFSLGYIPAPFSIYSSIKKLPASFNLHFNINDGALKTERFYLEQKDMSTKSENQLLEEFNYLFNDSIKLRLRSDVNVGAFLSGGIDSSSVVKFMLNHSNEEKLHTYSIGFDGKYDESSFINIACESLQVKNNHHEYFKNDFFAKYEDIYMESFDEPFADYSGFSSLMVSELGKKYSTVILSGDGGDEVFGGYTIYNNAFYIDFASKLPKAILNILLKQVRFLPNSSTSKYLKAAFELALVPKNEFVSKYQSNSRFNPNILSEWSIPKLQECLNDCDNKLSESLIRFDQSFNTLPDKYLTKVDRTSMRYGVEVRSPYLDYRIVEFGNNLPLNLKVSFRNNKIFLKKFLANKLDDRILYRSKQGFTPPYVEWISNNPDKDVSSLEYVDLYSENITLFYKQKVFKNPYDRFNKEYLIRLYLFNKWYKKWQFVN